jgi:ElaB/YqjD/DUF883 family membrane-anchored ribosome-binding protein
MNARDEATAKDMEALRLEMQQLRTDFSAMGKTLRDMAGNVGNDAYARMRDSAEKAKVRAGHAADTMTQSIEERPLTSVVVAFALGLVMGVVFGRQR